MTGGNTAGVARMRMRRPAWLLKTGTRVWWHYRSAIGHGDVAGVEKLGRDHAHTLYRIRQSDHHKAEPAIVLHYGSALTKGAGPR